MDEYDSRYGIWNMGYEYGTGWGAGYAPGENPHPSTSNLRWQALMIITTLYPII